MLEQQPPKPQESPQDLTPIKAQVYKDPRPKEYFDRFHERSRTRHPDWVYEAVRVVTTLYAWVFFRTRGIAPDKVPGEGPVILAPNHFSFMDHFFLGVSIRRKVRFMAKSQLFTRPLQFIYTHGGVSSSATARWRCTARAAARARASCPSSPSAASGGSR
jgi:1-acyl-sn-glycerol-3-phosphate acyltransferase